MTSVVTKVQGLLCTTRGKVDHLQFVYQTNRSVDDVVVLALHFICQHIESPGSHTHHLFIDYISAFNTFIPKKLFNKLSAVDLSQSVCFYIADFLVYRPQKIRVKDGLSNWCSSQTHCKIVSALPSYTVFSPIKVSRLTDPFG